MPDKPDNLMKEVKFITLDELTESVNNFNRIQKLEEAGNRLAFLMLNGSTDEMRKAIWEWRELVPAKKDETK